LKRQREFVDSVTRLAEPLCTAEGMELVHVEYQREPGGLTLRLYLDKPGGVTLDDCVEISRQLDDILDVHARKIFRLIGWRFRRRDRPAGGKT
jgi:ribosome maturation factor RimP